MHHCLNQYYCIADVQVVFRSGQGALQVLPPLVDVIPEARLNLVIYHLRQGVRLFTLIICYTFILFLSWLGMFLFTNALH